MYGNHPPTLTLPRKRWREPAPAVTFFSLPLKGEGWGGGGATKRGGGV
jgi:hypothetical protein